MDKNGIKLFLFDLDGTLVSTGGTGLRALNRAFSELYGIKDVTSLVNPSGMTDPAIFRQILMKKFGRAMEPDEYTLISRSYLSHLAQEMEKPDGFMVLPGVREFVQYLASREEAVMGLGTGNLEEGARIKLAPTKLNDFFYFGGFGSDAESRPRLLEIGRERAERFAKRPIPKGNVYIVGDTVLDIRAAREAGFKAVSVAAGSSSYEALNENNPDYLLRDLRHGVDFYEKMRAGKNEEGADN